MFAEFYAQSPLLFWPLVGLVIFAVGFVAVLLYVAYGLRERSKIEYLSALPLQADAELAFENHVEDMVEVGGRNEH